MRVRTRRLPAGYDELEYIESTGTQWIETDVIPTTTTQIDLDFQFTEAHGYDGSTNSNLNGARQRNDMSTRFYPAAGASATTWRINWGNTELYFNNILDRHYVQFNTSNHDLYVDNVYQTTYSTGNINLTNATKAIWLFRGNTENNASQYWASLEKIYSCKIYQNNELIRNFLPAERLSDNKPGLYDTVNSVFYANAGTGEFIKGPYASCSYQASLTLLPSEYQEVKYIEGSGTQFIKTTYVPTAATSLDLQFMVTSTQTSGGGWEQITGEKTAYHSTSSFQVAFCTLSGSTNNHLGLDYGQANDLAATTLPGIDRNVIINVKMTPNNWIVNNTHVIPHNYSLSGTGIPLWIFDCNKANTNERPFIGRIYFYKIYENKNLMHNFIPCYRKSDNVIGLYDTVGKQFYVNQGTGTFKKGNDITDKFYNKAAENYIYADMTATSYTWSGNYPILEYDIELQI